MNAKSHGCLCLQLTCNPVYYQTVRLEFKALQLSIAPPVRPPTPPAVACVSHQLGCLQIMVEVWDYDRLSANQLIGTARVSMNAAFMLPHDKVREPATRGGPRPTPCSLTPGAVVAGR